MFHSTQFNDFFQPTDQFFFLTVYDQTRVKKDLSILESNGRLNRDHLDAKLKSEISLLVSTLVEELT